MRLTARLVRRENRKREKVTNYGPNLGLSCCYWKEITHFNHKVYGQD